MAKRRQKAQDDDTLPEQYALTVGSRIGSASGAPAPVRGDQSYRRTRIGFKPPKKSKGARGRNARPRRKPGAHA